MFNTTDHQVTTAVLLAAGTGSRLQSLTEDAPQCLSAINGILAAKLNIESDFGGRSDSVCDAPFLTHRVSMFLSYELSYLVRTLAVSPASIGLVNISSLTAWIVPVAAPAIAGCFIISYLY